MNLCAKCGYPVRAAMPTFKLKLDTSDPETRRILESARRTAAEVATWPAWKANECRCDVPKSADRRRKGRTRMTYPANPTRAPMRPIAVTFDGCSDTFLGYTDGRTWNGYQCPHFTHAEAERVVAFLCRHGEDVWLAAPTAIESHPGEPDRGFAYATRHLTTDGSRVLFDFGGMGWCFVEAPNDDRGDVIMAGEEG